MLTYKISYNPAKDTGKSALDKDINFLCSDNKIHIRLREYDKPEVINGFINKLTYVITYLIQRQIVGTKSAEEIIHKFTSNDSDFIALKTWLANNFLARGIKFSGIKVTKNYRKIKKTTEYPLGNFAEGTCFLEDGNKWANLNTLEQSFGYFNFIEFLFNDAVEVEISQDEPAATQSYIKFTNKAKKKISTQKLEYIPLF